MTWPELQQELTRGQVAPVYLLYGEEKYLLAQAVKALKETLLSPEAEPFDYQEFAGEDLVPESLSVLASTPPVLGRKRLILIKNARLDGEALVTYLTHPSPTACLVLIAPGNIDRKGKVFQLLQKVGRCVDFAPLKPGALARWLAQEARRMGRKIEGPAAMALAQAAGNLQQGILELAKLDLYLPPGTPITLQEVQALVPAALASDTIFQMVDALGSGRAEVAIGLCRRLLAAGEAPLGILGMMVRQFRLILQAHLAGPDSPDLAVALHLPPFVAQKVARQAARFSPEAASEVLELFLQTDVDLKTGAGNPAFLLERAIWAATRRGKRVG
ncbi:DNA polymerase III subunit delta [Thermanaeromonas sp. C210]|uniref:DNA polymerase III subunit delta n=1 Tax=Thermanaeromonas sp. C210 TaxID=2731925 RepID=UPI00155CA7AD|nr:DNA polymerase III subunit delta [Thermanaeromonas sp. C210]GFN22557.1 DNA polymerase III subunit delta [Thermanaeromonas sp. C210]